MCKSNMQKQSQRLVCSILIHLSNTEQSKDFVDLLYLLINQAKHLNLAEMTETFYHKCEVKETSNEVGAVFEQNITRFKM